MAMDSFGKDFAVDAGASLELSSDKARDVQTAATRPLVKIPEFWFYGLSSLAMAIKDNAFSFLLFSYCNQVLKIPGYMAALAMALTLIWDAVSDVIIGYVSDRTVSSLGRRHPYMYASLFIFPPSFYAFFNPIITLDSSSWYSQPFLYVLVGGIVVRTGTTLFEIPALSLLPDLEKDYERRNIWLACRFCFGIFGAAAIQVCNFKHWVGFYGTNSQTGYSIFARYGTVAIFLAMLISMLGTQSLARSLPKPTTPLRMTSGIRHELSQALTSISNDNFKALFRCSVVGGVVQGLVSALSLTMMKLFYGLSSEQIASLAFAYVLSPFMAAFVSPILSKRFGKKNTAILVSWIAIIFQPVPLMMVIYGWWPTLGSTNAFWAYATYVTVIFVFFSVKGVMYDSMMADVVEDGEVSTSQRSEGLYYAARGFGKKIISGCGIIFGGSLVSFVGLDQIDSLDDMTAEKRFSIVQVYVPLCLLLNLMEVYLLSKYNIDREAHEANLRKLAGSAPRDRAQTDSTVVNSFAAASFNVVPAQQI
jgi:Na+/melibiose symporter-like transporter